MLVNFQNQSVGGGYLPPAPGPQMQYDQRALDAMREQFRRIIDYRVRSGQLTEPLAQWLWSKFGNDQYSMLEGVMRQHQNYNDDNLRRMCENCIAGWLSAQQQAQWQQNSAMPQYGYNASPWSGYRYPTATPVAEYGDDPVPTQPAQRTSTYTPKEEPPQQKEAPEPTIVEIQVEKKFKKPDTGDPDPIYKDAQWETKTGKLSVYTLVTHEGDTIKHVQVNLNDNPSLCEKEAIAKACRLYTLPHPCHMEITWSKVDRLGIDYDTLKGVIDQVKVSCQTNYNNLQYLKTVLDALKKLTRGPSDELEQYLCARFNKIARKACNTSKAKTECTIDKFGDIVELSMKDSIDPAVKSWQKIDKFREQFTGVCQEAIRDWFLGVRLLDPNNKDDYKLIQDTVPVAVQDSDGNVVRVQEDLGGMDHLSKEDAGVLGKAGLFVWETTAFIVPDNYTTYTSFLPVPIGNLFAIPNNICLSGKSDEADCLFEYFISEIRTNDSLYNKVIFRQGNAELEYHLSKCTDGNYCLCRA